MKGVKMANFDTAYAITQKKEGGYANNLKDRGGETFHGIARNFWPKWKGWTLIDAHRKKFPMGINDSRNWKIVDKILEAEPRLKSLVKAFYQANFWDDVEGDALRSQAVANILFDWAVNSGEGSPAKAIQRIVGAKVDGDIGPATAIKINAYPSQEALPTLLRSERVKMIKKIVQNDPTQSVFLNTWLSRAQSV
jgi:lysozyme family protein